ncbi:MAG TPA: peroxidase-related enzyme [Dehalococcoidia bacterium]|nr:peroxidase-related enzyme [Dehalococcoidia bacterium]
MTTAPARIRVVQESEATGETAELYQRLREAFRVPLVPDVFKLASLRPDFLRVLTDGYESMFLRGVLPREVKETIATVVSQTNACQYCTRAHSLFMTAFGVSQESAQAIESGDIDGAAVDERYRGLLLLAAKVTQHAYKVTDEDIAALKSAGLSDEEVLEGVFVACMFNGINRLADTFGLFELMQLREAQ